MCIEILAVSKVLIMQYLLKVGSEYIIMKSSIYLGRCYLSQYVLK